MVGSEYTKRQEGNSYIFDVRPAQSPKFILLAVGGVILALLGLILGPIGWIIFVPIGVFGVWFGYFRDLRPQAHRTPSTFQVTATKIEGNGRSFLKDDIHRLIIKNGITNEVVGVPNLLIPIGNSMAIGMLHRAKVATVANALEVETGGKGYPLAGGMDQTTAFGLLHDVSKVMGFSTA